MLLDEVANLGAQADTTVTMVEDHSRQLGELSVMMQTMQEMLGAQQECLMQAEATLWDWVDHLVARETTVNERLMWLQDRVNVMNVDKEEAAAAAQLLQISSLLAGVHLQVFEVVQHLHL